MGHCINTLVKLSLIFDREYAKPHGPRIEKKIHLVLNFRIVEKNSLHFCLKAFSFLFGLESHGHTWKQTSRSLTESLFSFFFLRFCELVILSSKPKIPAFSSLSQEGLHNPWACSHYDRPGYYRGTCERQGRQQLRIHTHEAWRMVSGFCQLTLVYFSAARILPFILT